MLTRVRTEGRSILQTLFVKSGVYTTLSTHGGSVPVGCSLIWTPTNPGYPVDLDIEYLLDGCGRSGAADTLARAELMQGGTLIDTSGSPAGFSTAVGSQHFQLKGLHRLLNVSGSTAITFSLNLGCWKGTTASDGMVYANWGQGGAFTSSLGGATLGTYLKITEHGR